MTDTNTNLLALASASDIKALITAGGVSHDDAIARVDAVLTRKTLTDGKKARWTRLRAWIVTNRDENIAHSQESTHVPHIS